MFILNLSHGIRSFVTFMKIYREPNQLQLQTMDITEFCHGANVNSVDVSYFVIKVMIKNMISG